MDIGRYIAGKPEAPGRDNVARGFIHAGAHLPCCVLTHAHREGAAAVASLLLGAGAEGPPLPELMKDAAQVLWGRAQGL